MKTKINIAIFTLFIVNCFAQFEENHPDFAAISGGYGLSIPIIPNTEKTLWRGFHYREKHIGFSYYSTDLDFHPAMDIDTSGKGKSFILDYIVPINKFKLGNRSETGTSGWLLQPSLGGYVQFLTFPGGKSTAFGLCPELHCQLPYALFSLKLNAGYNFAGSESGLAQNTKGFVFFPQLSVQFDALTKLHNLCSEHTGTITRYGQYDEHLYDVGDWSFFKRHYYTIKADWFTKVIDPFWAILLKADFGTKLPVLTYNFGAGFSGRWHLFMADTYLSHGRYFAKGFNDVDKDRQPSNSSLFDGQVDASGINLNAGIDVWMALKKLLFPNAFAYIDEGFSSKFTPFRSVFMGMGFNYLVPGKTEFVNNTLAMDSLNTYFAANPDIQRNALNDPSITKSGLGMNFFIQIEVASIGITFNANVQQKMGVNSTVGIIYLIPLKKEE